MKKKFPVHHRNRNIAAVKYRNQIAHQIISSECSMETQSRRTVRIPFTERMFSELQKICAWNDFNIDLCLYTTHIRGARFSKMKTRNPILWNRFVWQTFMSDAANQTDRDWCGGSADEFFYHKSNFRFLVVKRHLYAWNKTIFSPFKIIAKNTVRFSMYFLGER